MIWRSIDSDLRAAKRDLKAVEAQRDYLRHQLGLVEQEAAALQAGLTEMGRLCDRLQRERDEAQGALLGLELEMRKGEW